MKNALLSFISKYIDLSADETKALLSLDIFRSVKKKDILLEQGTRIDHGFFVLKGCLRTYYLVEGEEKSTGFFTEMEVLSPHCVVSKKPSTYYIDCVEDSNLYVSNYKL